LVGSLALVRALSIVGWPSLCTIEQLVFLFRKPPWNRLAPTNLQVAYKFCKFLQNTQTKFKSSRSTSRASTRQPPSSIATAIATMFHLRAAAVSTSLGTRALSKKAITWLMTNAYAGSPQRKSQIEDAVVKFAADAGIDRRGASDGMALVRYALLNFQTHSAHESTLIAELSTRERP